MLARKSFLIFLTNIVGAVLGVVALFFVGRFFEPGPYGMVWFAISFLTIIGAFTKLGFAKAHVKRVSEGRDLAKCMGTYITINGIIIVVSLAIALAIVITREITVGWVAATSFSVLLVVIAYKTLSKIRAFIKTTFDALRLTASNEFAVLTESIVRLPLIIIVTLLFASSRGKAVPLEGFWTRLTGWIGGLPPMSDELGAILYASAYAGGVLVSLIVAIWLMRRHQIPIGRFDRDLAKSYWVFAWPVAAYTIVNTLAQHIDTVMIGYFWTGTEVGFYRAGYQFVAIVSIIPIAVSTLFFPMINELISERKWDAARDLALTTQRFMGMVMIPILMLTILYADDVFRIVMSLTWTPAAPVLRLLVLTATLTLFTMIIISTLLGIERLKTVMVVSLIGFLLNMMLNVIFIPSSILGVPMFGLRMTGAALATVLSKAVVTIIFLVVIKRVMKQSYFSKSILVHLLAAGLAGGILWSADHYFTFIQVVRVWELAIASLAGVTLYVGFLWALREFRRKDLLFFVDLLNPGQMNRYVRDELKGRR